MVTRAALIAAATCACMLSARGARTGRARGSNGMLRPAEPTRSVWDSVYSDSQAARGDSLYKRQCAGCHGATLAGTDSAATLTGATFLGNWNGLALSELYNKILTTMPPDKPSSMPRSDVADVLAYMLAQNRFPSGAKPLSADDSALKDIEFRQTKP